MPLEFVVADVGYVGFFVELVKSLGKQICVKAQQGRVEIISGLSEGQEVITGPSRVLKTLKAGDKVKKQTRTPGANANAGG